MEQMTKDQWLQAFEEVKKQDCKLLDKILSASASTVDGSEAMKHAQAALNFTQAIANKYSILLPNKPKGFYKEDEA